MLSGLQLHSLLLMMTVSADIPFPFPSPAFPGTSHIQCTITQPTRPSSAPPLTAHRHHGDEQRYKRGDGPPPQVHVPSLRPSRIEANAAAFSTRPESMAAKGRNQGFRAELGREGGTAGANHQPHPYPYEWDPLAGERERVVFEGPFEERRGDPCMVAAMAPLMESRWMSPPEVLLTEEGSAAAAASPQVSRPWMEPVLAEPADTPFPFPSPAFPGTSHILRTITKPTHSASAPPFPAHRHDGSEQRYERSYGPPPQVPVPSLRPGHPQANVTASVTRLEAMAAEDRAQGPRIELGREGGTEGVLPVVYIPGLMSPEHGGWFELEPVDALEAAGMCQVMVPQALQMAAPVLLQDSEPEEGAVHSGSNIQWMEGNALSQQQDCLPAFTEPTVEAAFTQELPVLGWYVEDGLPHHQLPQQWKMPSMDPVDNLVPSPPQTLHRFHQQQLEEIVRGQRQERELLKQQLLQMSEYEAAEQAGTMREDIARRQR